ncbi:Phospholipase A2 isozymes PA3A/PA3B/PA5 [Toxocara canis]|uniref:Phospholipase A2 isozymes PA3A/PA3B/PA5 n=1 Tax=Toxocara canis TaxID=6265 RepID=A0A0B2VTP7_TOXCA|nr:Phospholipase A2 isozymes PA3A/PA3B/PA5 [Toxocara canis]
MRTIAALCLFTNVLYAILLRISAFRNVAIMTYVLHEENSNKYIVTKAAVPIGTNESSVVFSKETFGFENDLSATYSGDIVLHCREIPFRDNQVLLGEVQHTIEESVNVNHEYAKIANDCSAGAAANGRKRRHSAAYVIGEDWCDAPNGEVNSAIHHAIEEKICCKQHKFCPLFIPVSIEKYGHLNKLPYTISHCDCDLRFESCLKKVNSSTADFIGTLYFNTLPRQCFELRREHTCTKWKRRGVCAEHNTMLKAIFKDLSYY